MFDLSNISSNPIELTGYFEGNFQTGATGTVEMWYGTGSYVGHESDLTGWTILGTAAITSNGTNVPTPYNVGNTLLVNTGVTFGMFMYLDGT